MTGDHDDTPAMPPNGIVFVCGSLRSGTTMLQKILCTAPETHPFINGCRYLTEQMSILSRFAGPERPFVDEYFGDVDGLRRFTRAVVDAFLSETWKTNGQPQTLVLKSPELSFFAPDLARMIPASRFVYIVRDPKDTVASMIAVGERMRQAGIAAPLSQVGRNIGVLCQMLLSHYRPALEELDGADSVLRERVHFVRYEDIARDTTASVARLGAFCRLSPVLSTDPDHPWRTGDGLRSIEAHPKWRHYLTGLYQGPVTEASIGRHRHVLSAAEAAAVDRHCAAFRSRFGYT